MKNDVVYLLTDGCMWEKNKREGSSHSHAIEVVDTKTGAIRYIRSGSKISFIGGSISDLRTQEAYNKATSTKVSPNRQIVQKRTSCKTSGKVYGFTSL